MKNRKVPIIPVYLDRRWGSIFSHEGGRFLSKIPRELPYPVTVAFGKALDADTSIPGIRLASGELASDVGRFECKILTLLLNLSCPALFLP